MQVTCAGCGKTFEGKRSTARYCGASCRQRGRRRGGAAAPADDDQATTATTAPAGELELVDVYRQALLEVDRLNTPLGQHVLVLARKMTGAFETGSGVAALSRQLDAVFDKAMQGVARGDAVDEFTKRLRAKQEKAGRVG